MTTEAGLLLYDSPLSGHAHRARLMLALLGISHRTEPVDLRSGAQKAPDYLALNPFGTVPVLVDDGRVIADSNAILVYLALTRDPARTWLPEDPVRAAEVQQWLSVAQGPLYRGPHLARLGALFGHPVDQDLAREGGRVLLQRLDAHLAERDWLVGDAPTIADVALYSYVAAAPQGGLALEGLDGVLRWLGRIEGLPGFTPMAGVDAGARL